MNAPSQTSRIRGSFLGLAYGDVLGCPVETWRAAEILAVFGDYRELPSDYPLAIIQQAAPRLLQGARIRLWPIGLYSDDTQQSMALINICLAGGGWREESPSHWAQWIVRGMQRREHPAWRGYGRRGFKFACDRLAAHAAPQESGNPDHPGIGAAMRCAPFGALCDDREALRKAVMESSFMTHANLIAGACAYACAWSAQQLIAGRDVRDVRNCLADEVASAEAEWLAGHFEWRINRLPGHTFSDRLRDVLRAIPDNGDAGENGGSGADRVLQAVRDRIVSLEAAARGPQDAPPHPNAGQAVLGGLHGIAASLIPQGSPQEILSSIVRLGGDTDTVAAIAGGILGARHGADGMDLRRVIGRDRLNAYADALVDRHRAPESLDAFIRYERELTGLERRFLASIARVSG